MVILAPAKKIGGIVGQV